MKAMISQPMNGLGEEDIKKTRDRAIAVLESRGYEVVNSYFKEEWGKPENMKKAGVVNNPVFFLAKSLEKTSECDAVYFCKGYENARGCKIERAVAEAYGFTVIDE